MRAVRMHRHGGPEVLQVDDVDPPRAPRGDEVRVRVAASSVNGTDLGLRRGDLRIATAGRLPVTLGFDLAGTVVGCGPAVTGFGVGDRVMALLGHVGRAQAEEVLVGQRRAAAVPDGITDDEAAAVPLAGLTALQALFGVGGLALRGPRPRVLVIGASGGIGAWAVQLARVAGAHVTGVSRGSALDQVTAWGAHEVVDRQTYDVPALDATWDVVLDCAGRYRFRALRHLLHDGGVMVSTRPVSGDAWRAIAGGPRGRSARPREGFGFVATTPRVGDLDRLGRLLATGRVRVPLDRTFEADDAVDAHRHAEGAAVGKVVVRLAAP